MNEQQNLNRYFLEKKITTQFERQFKHLITFLNRIEEIEPEISP